MIYRNKTHDITATATYSFWVLGPSPHRGSELLPLDPGGLLPPDPLSLPLRSR